jgi:hypothetical protein
MKYRINWSGRAIDYTQDEIERSLSTAGAIFEVHTEDSMIALTSQALSEGILQVWVNGISVYKDGKSTHQFPGMVITRN